MKVLVTGGAGFIGSNLAERLVDSGHYVVVLDNLSTGEEKNIHPEAHFICGDVRDYETVLTALNGVEVVFHLAAFVSVQESLKKPDECLAVNAGGTANIIKAAGESGVKKIVFSSSCAVYGDAGSKSVKEADKVNLLSPYSTSKLDAERLLIDNNSKYGYSYVILRYFNVFGERQNPHSPYSAVVPKFISSALDGKDIVVYGDGTQTRDFVYVEDVVDINMLAMTSGINNGIYNVGSGRGMTINRLAGLVIENCNSGSQIRHEDGKTGDIRYSLADISKIKKDLGWYPKYDFGEALSKTVRWYKQHS